MKRLVSVLLVLVVIGAAAYLFLTRTDDSAGAAPLIAGAPADAALLLRGEYLTKAADCIACHTVAGSGKPFAGGVAFVLPFGTIYSTNITADEATGIGRYTDEQFLHAVHDGLRGDGQRLYPAFPYTAYTRMSRDDVLAIKAYLATLPKIVQANQEPELDFPFNQRWAMGLWNAVAFKNQRFVPDASKSAQWNSGAYLATALGHCAECHTPRNLFYGLEHRHELAGATQQGWRAFNITSDTTQGIGAWSDADIASYLTTGHAEGRGSAGGPMGEAVANSLQYLNPQDTAALVAYLRSVPPREGADPIAIDAKPAAAMAATAMAPAANNTPALEQGLKLFSGACASCHQWNGQGQQLAAAGLLGSSSVNDRAGLNVAQMILEGVDMQVRGTAVYMPAYASAYSDTEVAALANVVIAQFGNKQGQVTPDFVAAQRKGQQP